MQSVKSDIDIYSFMSLVVELLILHDMSDCGLSSFLKPATIWALAGYLKHIKYILPFKKEQSCRALHYLYWSCIENPQQREPLNSY